MTPPLPPARQSRLPVPPPDAEGDALWSEYEATAAAFRTAQAAYESALEEGDEDRAALFAPEVLAAYEKALQLDRALRQRVPPAPSRVTGRGRPAGNTLVLLATIGVLVFLYCCGGFGSPWWQWMPWLPPWVPFF